MDSTVRVGFVECDGRILGVGRIEADTRASSTGINREAHLRHQLGKLFPFHRRKPLRFTFLSIQQLVCEFASFL